MVRALDLAWRGWGKVQQDPLVGAVILRDGELVGEGWHPEYGDRHAETVALADAGERSGARGRHPEPCSHQGISRRAPTRSSLGVARSSPPARPNPLAGALERLREAGVSRDWTSGIRRRGSEAKFFMAPDHTLRSSLQAGTT